MSKENTLSAKLREAAGLGDELAREATALSDSLTLLEAALQQLPGKADVDVVLSKNRLLRFCRSGPAWRLLVEDHYSKSANILTNCSIDDKVEAALAVPALIAELAEVNRKKLERVREARSRISAVMPSILDTVKKEGA